MPSREEIRKKLDILFGEEESNLFQIQTPYFAHPHDRSIPSELRPALHGGPDKTQNEICEIQETIIDSPHSYEIFYQNLVLLNNFHLKLTNEEKKYVVEYIGEIIFENDTKEAPQPQAFALPPIGPIFGYDALHNSISIRDRQKESELMGKKAKLAYYFIFQDYKILIIGDLKDRFDKIYKHKKVFFYVLQHYLAFRYYQFSADELDAIKAFINTRRSQLSAESTWLSKILNSIYNLLHQIEYLILKNEIMGGDNKEINEDQKFVRDQILKYGFNKELNEILENIDNNIFSARSDFDFKSCIDKTRSFLENFMKEVYSSFCSLKNIAKDLDDKKFANYLSKLQSDKYRFLTFNEAELVQKLYNLMSTESAHKLSAPREYIRLSKNITIEIAKLLFDRLGTLKSQSHSR
ncbi:MAG: hypothetical protein CO189_08055 [candidate division Zixibacteria bacterium CG_4_9_14_3_um_filter_46_8]|nr:MAG: hypothetical protein CO189_08055 [candidate division Zixibacteria bacterium CG_4_9_14_3_um_filter_46_8]